MDWIEEQIGISPDGGNGAVEFLLLAALMFLLVGLVLRARAARSRRRPRN